MADELNENTQTSDFEESLSTASSSNKDLWLFLIIVDVILLCVFGFFLYKNLSAKLLAPQPAVPVKAEAAPVQEETTLTEEVISIAQEPAPEPEAAAPAAAAPVEPEPVAQTPVPLAESAPVIDLEPKESVIVKVNPKSKYRQVTFRYFDKANSVSVVSGFTMAKPRALTKKNNGVWEVTLAIAPGTYKYLFIVDGKQQLDPYAKEQNGRSLLVLE